MRGLGWRDTEIIKSTLRVLLKVLELEKVPNGILNSEGARGRTRIIRTFVKTIQMNDANPPQPGLTDSTSNTLSFWEKPMIHKH
jgi:hypothetical protein